MDHIYRTKKYKIIVLTGSLRQSGSSTWAINLTRAFCQEGHDAILLAMGDQEEVHIPTNLHAVFLGKSRTNFLVTMCHLFFIRKISRNACKKLEEWVYNNRVKKILHKFEADHPTDLIVKDFNTPTPKVFAGKKHLAIVHERVSDKYSAKYSKVCKRKQDPYTNIAAVSEFYASFCRENGLNVRHVLYNPLDIADIKKKAEAFTVNDDYVVFVGALIDRKNVVALLEAWYHSGIKQKLYYIGRGKKQEILQKKAHALGVSDRVVFTGFIANPLPYIKSAKALILPSHDEGMPYVCFEALALNTPIIVAGFKGAEEFYDKDSIVSLTPEENFNARLAKALIRVVHHEKKWQNTLEKNRAIKSMLFDSVVKNYLQLMGM